MRITILALPLLLALLLPAAGRADMIDPGFYYKRCDPGEEMVTCDYSFEHFGGEYKDNECVPYQDNPNYRYIGGTGGSLGGMEKYCLRVGAKSVEAARSEMVSFGAAGTVLAAGSFLLLRTIRKRNRGQK